ncbi:hypothetical protein MKX01_035042, partial [Papaver californicum]
MEDGVSLHHENIEEILKKFCKQHLVFDHKESFPVEELIKNFCEDQSLSSTLAANNNSNKQAEKTGLALIEAVEGSEEESSKLLRRKTPFLTAFINHKLVTQSDETVYQESVSCSELKKFDSSVSNSPKDDVVTQHTSLNVDQPSKQMINSNYSSTEKMKRLTCNNPHLLALGELEFKKVFLILSCCGKDNKLEDLISVDEIRRMKSLQMGHFETRLRKFFGDNEYMKQTDRTKNLDWDSEKTFVYHCHVDYDGSYTFKVCNSSITYKLVFIFLCSFVFYQLPSKSQKVFKLENMFLLFILASGFASYTCDFVNVQGPYLQKETTHLQRVLGDNNVLLVKFAGNEGDRNCSSSPVYRRIGKEGILVGLRRFQFFGTHTDQCWQQKQKE